jgi:hypothetical protein
LNANGQAEEAAARKINSVTFAGPAAPTSPTTFDLIAPHIATSTLLFKMMARVRGLRNCQISSNLWMSLQTYLYWGISAPSI